MSVVPRKTTEMISWCQARAPQWLGNFAAIGLSNSAATQFNTLTNAAVTALQNQETALEAYRNATLLLTDAARDLRRAAGDDVNIIRAFAEIQTKPIEVYTTAMIPPPAAPTPMPAPGLPSDLVVALEPSGALSLRWKCQNPPGAQGTVYIVERRLNGTGAFAFRAAAGERRLIDDTVPAGSSQVEYKIWGQRADSVGTANFFTVRFGVGGGGGFAITQQFSGEDAAKLAA